MSRTLSAAYSPFRTSNLPLRLPLHPERLDHRHPRHVLLQEGVHPRELPPHLPVRLADPFFEQLDEQHEDGQDAEGDQRKPQVHPEQDRGRARQHRDVADRRNEAGGDQLLERLDVGGQARHEAPGRRAVEEDDGEPLHPREHVPPQREDHPLPEDRHGVHLQVDEPHGPDKSREVQEDPSPHPGKLTGDHVPVDDDLDEVRPGQLAGGPAEKRRQRRREETPVGEDVSQEAREEAPVDPAGVGAVVREEVVRPVLHDDSSSSRASIWREYRPK